jgi:mannose-6-phosphate isomerase-like protein (cupin superfamily)
LIVAVFAVPAAAQRRATGTTGSTGSVTFAIAVADPSGSPIPDVQVNLTGPTQRTGRTEAGKLVFENLPAGDYTFHFEKDGFVPFERELTARGSKPIDVKVTLDAAPPPPKPIEPVAPPPAVRTVNAKPEAVDLPGYIEKNYVGRAPGKRDQIACATGGSSSILQINEPIKSHTHADADEFLYVIAGQGSAHVGTGDQLLSSGMFVLIPRGMAHSLTAGPKKPLVVLSTLAGGSCGS